MSLPAPIEVSVSRIEPEASIEEVALIINEVDALKHLIAAVEKEMKRRCIEWIEVNGRPIEFANGPDSVMRYTVGYRKDVKCRDVKAALETLLKVSHGDFDAVVACLSSSAWKHGAARKLLADVGQPDEYDRLFETVEVATLKGEPRERELLKLDTRFLGR